MESKWKTTMYFFPSIIIMADELNNGPEYRRPLNGTGVRRISESVTKIGTWNVRSMFQAGKLRNTIQEMERLNIDILGISEMRWPDSGRCEVAGYVVYHSGGMYKQHQSGVGIIIREDMGSSVNSFVPFSERLLLLQIKANPVNINVIQVYAPTADKPDDEIEQFYNDITQLLRGIKKEELIIVLGDFNAKVGQGREGEFVGNYGLGSRNTRGDRLAEFCREEELAILNTYYKLPMRRLYTWKSPRDSPNNIVRNQIDYILINKRFRNSFTSVKTYPGADVASDHNPLVGTFKVRFKKVPKKKRGCELDMRRLKEGDIREQVVSTLEKSNSLTGHRVRTGEIRSVEEIWTELKQAVENTSKNFLQSKESEKRKMWMTKDILELMNCRRQYKDSNPGKYKKCQKIIRQKIREAKNIWWRGECNKLEKLDQKHDSYNMHRKIKQMTGMDKTRPSSCLFDKYGMIVTENEHRLKVWQEHVENIFRDVRTDTPPISKDGTGPEITKEEVKKALSLSKDGKAPGPDGTHAEVWKMLEDEGMELLTTLFNLIYTTGTMPSDWLKSTFIPIPKKSSAKQCNDFRTICLMSHAFKILLKVIRNRIYRKCEENIGKTQFGFRDALGTREALYCLQVLFQRCRDVNCDVYACFIDYQKAFDTVRHEHLINILKRTGLDDKDVRLIANLYWQQSAAVKVGDQTSESFQVQRGVRQGCTLSPLLYNIYSEEIFKEALADSNIGISINGELLNNIRYADDTVIFASNLQDLQTILGSVVNASEKYGLSLNIKKTKYMIISKRTVNPGNLMINGGAIERVKKYTYLGAIISDDWDTATEVKHRIGMARTAFTKIKSLLTSKELQICTKVRLAKCYVFSVLLYGVETWTLTQASCKKIEAFEMWVYRRILRISWVDRVTNQRVLERLNKELEIMVTIKKRQLQYFGHIMRNTDRYSMLQLVLQGKVLGKRGPGRRRNSWLKNLRQWFGMTSVQLFRAAVNKIKIVMMIANIRNG